MLGRNISLNKFERTGIIQSMFSNCNETKLENNKKEIWGIHIYGEINSFLNKQ